MIPQFGNIAGGGKFVTSPTSVSATVSGLTASVAFTAATYAGKEIAVYTVTSIPGGLTASGSSSPISVSGLTSNTAYTFTVTTDSTYGVRATSSPSNSVTPPYFPPYFPPFFPPYFPPFFPPYFPPYFPPFFPPFFPPYFPPYFPPSFTPACTSCTPTGSGYTHDGCPGSGNCVRPFTTYGCLPAGCAGCNCPTVYGSCSGPSCP